MAPLLLLALKSANVGVIIKHPDGRCAYVSGLPDYFPQLDAQELTDEALFEADWLPLIKEAQEKALSTGEKVVLELSRSGNRQYCACECTVQRYEIRPGAIGSILTFSDYTHEKKREDTLRALLRELSHRTKNQLAIVQSIATQTALSSDDLETFVESFRGRIAALSSAQDLVVDSNWRGAMFNDLVARLLSRFVDDQDTRIEVSGTNVLLLPNGATYVGLALHELIVNAVAYGALSNGSGHVRLSSRQTGDGMFEILWDESTVGDPVEPERGAIGARDFSSTVLQRIVPAALEGTADYTVDRGTVKYRLRFAP